MATTSMTTVRFEVPAEVERRASEVFGRQGLTVGEAVALILKQIAESGESSLAPGEESGGSEMEEEPGYDAWVRAELEEAMNDTSPGIPHEVAMAEWHAVRDELLAKLTVKDAA